jgi:hypothetical protein
MALAIVASCLLGISVALAVMYAVQSLKDNEQTTTTITTSIAATMAIQG